MAQMVIVSLHAHLESKAETFIRRTWEQAAQLQLEIERAPEGIRPHMTMGSWRLADVPPGFTEKLVATLSTLPTVQLRLNLQLGIKEFVHFYLVPVINHDLLAYHEHLHKAIGDVGRRYRPTDFPGSWAPHVSTFACREKDLPTAFQIIKCLPYPLATSITGMGLVRYGEGEIKTLASFDLAKPA